MAYIFLSFSDNLDKTTFLKNEFYRQSLNEQFKNLQNRIPSEKRKISFKEFIQLCFPSDFTKKYFLSCPNFLREKRQKIEGGPSYLNNVVIRPEITLFMKNYLPENQNVILIGDIYENNKLKMFQVKGIEFIDDSMSSPNDMIVLEKVCYSFERGYWSVKNVNFNDTFFTPNKVYELIENCFTVKNPEYVRNVYEEWNRYINFRKYYLEEQSKRNFKLDSAEFINSYAINRKDYKKNSFIYDDNLLDGLDAFKKGDMVILSSKIEDAESFPLIRLNIDRNKKEFLESRVLKKGKLVNEEEIKIRSLASDNVFITSIDPRSDSKYKSEDGKNQKVQFSELLNNGYPLGDRFKIISFDIQPIEHLNQLEIEYEQNISYGNNEIDEKYKRKIEEEFNEAINIFENDITLKINNLIDEKKKTLDNSLDSEVKNNNDSKILNKIAEEKRKIEKYYLDNYKINENESGIEYQKRLNDQIKLAFCKIDVKSFYIEKNNKIIEDFSKKQREEARQNISLYKTRKGNELKNKYKDDIRNEKIKLKEKLDEDLKLNKEKVNEEETIIRFSLYFRLNDQNNLINDKQIKKISECKYIVYDSRAENAKISRQETALENFYSGFVKNPYLSTFLFNPENLQPIVQDTNNWTWYLESLNEKQKEAVRKAVSSNSIFLLQGPPGTGKTQVIAETVAQLVKKGKKVLISSETHKAIDNVFERLPKIAEIVPIRLIPNNRKNENDYDPKFLVDNFYKNISTNMEKSIYRYENFKQNKEEFSEKFDRLKLLKRKIDKSQSILNNAYLEISQLESHTKHINSIISDLCDKKDNIKINIDTLRRTERHINRNDFKLDEDIDKEIIVIIYNELKTIFDSNYFVIFDICSLTKNISELKTDQIDKELLLINPDSNKTILEIKRNELKKELDIYIDEVGDLKDENDKEKVEEIRSQLRKVLEELKKENNKIDFKTLKIGEIFDSSYLVNNRDSIKELIISLKEKINEVKITHIYKIKNKIEKEELFLNDIENQIIKHKNEIKDINQKINEIQDREDIKDIQESKFKLEQEINKFFRDFEISNLNQDIDENLSIIKNKREELEYNFEKKEQENKEKIPMYKKISNYLSTNDVIESDRKIYTKKLFESANVFGITCTSNDKFNGRKIETLSEYNIDDIDIKSVGIDVVIIDEVSKSSFVDLLIPILYGKTVILVGDHRQLPPMYEFSKLRNSDFEGLDENIINVDINRKFTKLYEECFFKTLFEKIPNYYKTMLVQQYRCHEHIMHVFNHFYQGQLKLGFEGQNNLKNHNIKLISNGRTIIEPSKHIYFVDCKKNETHEQDSTSMYNIGEANVVAELIKKLNDYYKKNSDNEKLSIGVICTYGDQARKIKEVLKNEKIKTDAFKTDVEKMIVSTVDDFQGDERDIIIVSMVRNPECPSKSNPGFILAYQRINVALSRARRMLVIVGNRKYLETKGVIDLPSINGNGEDRRNFRVYEEIIYTIEQYGKVIDDIDVLEDKEVKING